MQKYITDIIAVIFITFLVVLIIAIFLFASSFIAMFCWNHSVVYLFHAPYASLWEMMCFVVLVGIIFSGFRITKN